MQSTAATLSYGHLEAFVRAGKREMGWGWGGWYDRHEDNDHFHFGKGEKRVTLKCTHTHIVAHGVITLHKTSNSIFRGDDLWDYIICFCIATEDSAPQ